MARARESASARAVGSFGLCLLILLAGPGRLAAQDGASTSLLAAADDGWATPSQPGSSGRSFYRLLPDDSRAPDPWMTCADLPTDSLGLGVDDQRATGTPLTSTDALASPAAGPASSTQPCPRHRLLSADSGEAEQRTAFASFVMDDAPLPDEPEAELPPSDFLLRHRLLVSTLIPVAAVGGVMANSLIGYQKNKSFRWHNEGWFGANTVNGGADKASHFADYFIVANLFEDIYRMLGYSEKAAILWGFGLSVATGFANEFSDAFTRHGFSPEDFAMDSAGAATASLISVTRTKDLLGVRGSHLPSDTYTHDVYSADLKLSGLGRRLALNIGPLRWLLFSVTYGAKGYRVQPPTQHQRQVGFEIGLNFQQILNDLDVRRNTWWGYSLHLVFDNVRLPFTAIGMRYDLNGGKWHGPNSGNYD